MRFTHSQFKQPGDLVSRLITENPTQKGLALQQAMKSSSWQNIVSAETEPTWFQQQPENQRTGVRFKALRVRANLSQLQLGELLGVSHTMIYYLEKDRQQIDVIHTGKLTELLARNDDEAKWIIHTMHPGITTYTGMAWLDAKLAAKDWDAISFPALDDSWLNKQPMTMRPAALLNDLRKRKGYNTVAEFAKHVGIDATAISRWENGTRPITPPQMPKLIDKLELSPAESARFTHIYKKAGPAWQKKRSIDNANIHLGALLAARKHPQLAVKDASKAK